jgi:predicted lactoylglutathione lyase
MEPPVMLSLDALDLGVPDVAAAHAFYRVAFAATAEEHGRFVNLDLRGTGQFELHAREALAADANADPATAGFRGWVLNCIVSQPSEVKALLEAATRGGAKVLKPAKKGFFGGFSAVFEAPDGTIWKLAAPTKKDTGPAGDPPTPTEVVAILGVAEPTASKAFYETLGMTVDRDYGNKFVDFRFEPGACRLGLMPRRELAKDAGVEAEGDGFPAMMLTRQTKSRNDAEQLLAAAASAGGRIVAAARETEQGVYSGHFTDPDGHLWKVTSL